MSNVIDLRKRREERKRRVEEIAMEKFSVIKVSDNTYLLPDRKFYSGSKELETFLADHHAIPGKMFEENLIQEINMLSSQSNRIITVVAHVKEDRSLVIIVSNGIKEHDFVIETKMSFNRENMEFFIALIAGVIERESVEVIHCLKLGIEELEHLVK